MDKMIAVIRNPHLSLVRGFILFRKLNKSSLLSLETAVNRAIELGYCSSVVSCCSGDFHMFGLMDFALLR